MHPLYTKAHVDISAMLFQVLSKEREIQRTREIKEDFSSRINSASEKLKAISAKFKEKSPDVDHAKEEVKVGSLLCFTWKYKLFMLEKKTKQISNLSFSESVREPGPLWPHPHRTGLFRARVWPPEPPAGQTAGRCHQQAIRDAPPHDSAGRLSQQLAQEG